MTAKQNRHTGLDLLRILAMLMVVTLHYFNENLGGVLGKADGPVYYLAWTVESFCYGAVNIFVLISGYFLCGREKTNVRKLAVLLLQVLFYSLGLYFLGCAFGVAEFSFKTLLLQYLFPTATGRWWFVTDYVLLYLLAPYINRALGTMNEKQHRRLTLLLVFLFSVIPSVFFFQVDVMGLAHGYSLLWFMVLYVIAAYIKAYGIRLPKLTWLAGFVFFSAVTAFVKFAQQILFEKEYFQLYHYTSVTVLGAAVCLFCLFRDLNIPGVRFGKVVSGMGALSFAAFLIHTHGAWVRWLWDDCVRATDHIGSLWEMTWHMTVSVLGIYAICTAVDALRKLLFDGGERLIGLMRRKK